MREKFTKVCTINEGRELYIKLMLYLRAELFSHQLQFFFKLRVKELHLFYIFLTATITHCNFSGVYAGCIIMASM
jgi:hypothetical protein